MTLNHKILKPVQGDMVQGDNIGVGCLSF